MDTDHAPIRWTARWTAGPDRDTAASLPSGRHVIGRAGGIRSTSTGMAAHHVIVDLGDDSGVRVLPLAAGVSVRLGDGCHLVEVSDAVLELRHGHASATQFEPPARESGSGHEKVAATRPPTSSSAVADPAMLLPDGTLLRRPRVVPTWEEPSLTAPEPPSEPTSGGGGLTPALIGLAGSGAIAVLLHQPMFVLFGAMGALVAVGSWVGQRVAARRAARRAERTYRTALATYDAALAETAAARARFVRGRVPTVAGAVAAASPAPTAALWARRPDHGDAFVVGVGIHAATGLPVAADLGAGARLAVHGLGAIDVATGLLAQLTTSVGPADVRIVVVSEQPSRWTPLEGIPHCRTGSAGVAITEAEIGEVLDASDERHTVIVTDHLTALATRTGTVRRTLRDHTALLAVVGDDEAVPQLCRGVLRLHTTTTGDGERRGEWTGDTRSASPAVPVIATGLAPAGMVALASSLRALRDPEDATAQRLPDAVTVEEVAGAWDDATIAERWAAGHDAPRATIGVAEDGLVDVDLVRDGPHALLAGTTGAGKSELLRTLVVGLAAAAPPEALQLVLVDYKGGATFDRLDRLPHVAAVVTDLDDHLAERALRALHAELRRRERVLREAGVADLSRLHRDGTTEVPPRLVVIVDEFAALVAEQPTFLHALVGVAQRGRSLGVHLLLATQRPAGVISDDIRANTNLRIALRLHDAADATDVVGDRLPATFPRRLPGRGVVRLGPDELVAFQTARVADTDAAVDAVCAAVTRHGTRPVDPPWPEPLPDELDRDGVPEGAVGWCDDPDRQRRVPLEWHGGALLVVGSTGSGVTSALHAVLARALEAPSTHAYVLTASADGPQRTRLHPRAEMVAVHEIDRVLQLLHRVTAHDGRPTVLVLDEVDAVRRALDDPATAGALDTLDRVLMDPALVVLAGTSHPSRLPSGLVARCAQRWVLHLHDPADASAIGVAARDVPVRVPGRAWIHELGLTAQLVRPQPLALVSGRRRADRAAIAPIDGVPARIERRTLPAARRDDGDLVLPIGRAVHTGDADGLVVPEGDRVLVLGGPRSGRSSALTTIVAGWRGATPDGTVVALLPRRSTFDRSLATSVHRDVDTAISAIEAAVSSSRTASRRPLLLVVDDADTVDDETGRLAALVGGRAGGVTVVAAARGDALRHRYGHWTTSLRAGRTGLIGTGDAAEDGDLLGVVLPRRAPIAPRPGLMWASDHRGTRLLQVAAPSIRSTTTRALASAR